MFQTASFWPRESDDPEVNAVSDEDFYAYRAGTAACTGQWDVARADLRAFRAIPPESGCASDEECCARMEVAAWVEGLLRIQDEDPGYVPIFEENPESSTCPTSSD